MRGFIVLCFSALAAAAPQGYNYPQGQISASQQLGYTAQSIQQNLQQLQHQQPQISSQNQYVAPQQQLEASISHQQQQQFIPQMLILSQPQQISAAPLPSFGVSHNQVAAQAQRQEAIVSKRFFIHSAPEEHDEEFKEKVLTVGTPRKNYNVVFIRAPSKSSKKTSIKITPAQNEEKTVIYVLSKKTDATDIEAHVQEVQSTTTKPEVYFIKYKTPEEAAHAQEKIQAEYDSLGGSTQVLNEGIAPVSSVIGVLGDKTTQQQQLVAQQSSGIAASVGPVAINQGQDILPTGSAASSSNLILNGSNSYLPPNYYH